MKLLILFVVALIVAYASASEFKCQSDVQYLVNNCNRCNCLKNNLMCTRMECPKPESKKMARCEVGTTSKRDCNDCWCVAKYGTVCTNQKCLYA